MLLQQFSGVEGAAETLHTIKEGKAVVRAYNSLRNLGDQGYEVFAQTGLLLSYLSVFFQENLVKVANDPPVKIF